MDNERHGIYLDSSKLNVICGNRITNNSETGLLARWAENDTAKENIIENNTNGIILESSESITILNNTIISNDIYGMWVNGTTLSNIEKNTLIRNLTGDDSWDFFIEGDDDDNNQFQENQVGHNHPTTVSFFYDIYESFKLRGVEDSPESPKPPEYPTSRQNISYFVEGLNVTDSAPFTLEFHYQDEDVENITEDSLKVWKYNETGWYEGDFDNLWNGTRTLDTFENVVGVKVLEFCIFAPLAGLPVHNLDTGKSFETIQKAINDDDTDDGDTLQVDSGYTQAQTKENIKISIQLTIESTSGNPLENVIEANNSSDHVIFIFTDNVVIRGFTIMGATHMQGLRMEGQENVLIENCIFSENYFGVGLDRDDDGDTPTTNVTIKDSRFSSNTNGGIFIDRSNDLKIHHNTFDQNKYGIVLNITSNNKIHNNTFTNIEEIAIYEYGGEENNISDNHISDVKIGIAIEKTVEDEIANNEITNAEEYGIKLNDSDDNNLVDNEVASTPVGFFLIDSNDNELKNCDFTSEGSGSLIGIDLQDSKRNELIGFEIHDLATIGYSAYGIRLFSSSTHNKIYHGEISGFDSSNSEAIIIDSLLNDLFNVSISNILTRGNFSSIGIRIMENANQNIFQDIAISRVTGNRNVSGVYLDGNMHNNFTDCRIENITSTDDRGTGYYLNDSSDLVIKDSDIINNDIGVFAFNGSNPGLHWNDIVDNIGFGINNTDSEVMLDARNNWWGDKSGPGGMGPGSGDKVSEYIDYEPWVGAEYTGKREETVSAGQGSVDARDGEADTVVDYDTTEDITITTMRYDSNPGTGFTGDVGKYIDVHVDDAVNVNELTIKLYYTQAELSGKDETKLAMTWWNGDEWTQCSNSGVNTQDIDGYEGYIWAMIRSDTTPDLEDLVGTPFGGIEMDDVTHSITIIIDEITDQIEPDLDISISGNVTIEPDEDIQHIKVFLDSVYKQDADIVNNSDFATRLTLPSDLTEGDHIITINVTLVSGESKTKDVTVNYETDEEPVIEELDILEIILPGDIKENDDVVIDVLVKNTGTGSISTFDVFFYYDELEIDSKQYTKTLQADQEAHVNTTWKAIKGSHTIKVVVTFKDNETEDSVEITVLEKDDTSDDDGGFLTAFMMIPTLGIVTITGLLFSRKKRLKDI